MDDTLYKEEKEYNKWSLEETKVLVELLVDGMKRGWRDASGTMNKATVENKILPVLNERLGCQKSHKNYQSRYKYLRTLYHAYLDLERNSSGFGWDPETKRFTASDEVWQGYIKAHPKHKSMKYESHEMFDDLKIIFDGTSANGNSSIGLGDTTDARTYQVGDNQVRENLSFCDSADDISSASLFLEKKDPTEKLIPKKKAKTEAWNKLEMLKSDSNESVVAVSNKILDIIQQREERQQKEAEKREEKQRLEAEQRETEKKRNNVWDAMKEITNLDQSPKFKAVNLIYSLGMKDVFADMSVEERYGWIKTNINSDS